MKHLSHKSFSQQEYRSISVTPNCDMPWAIMGGLAIYAGYKLYKRFSEQKHNQLFVFRMGQVSAKGIEVVDEFLFIVRSSQGIKEIIFEIQQITQYGLLAKFFGC